MKRSENLLTKEFWKSVHTSQSYDKASNVLLLWDNVYTLSFNNAQSPLTWQYIQYCIPDYWRCGRVVRRKSREIVGSRNECGVNDRVTCDLADTGRCLFPAQMDCCFIQWLCLQSSWRQRRFSLGHWKTKNSLTTKSNARFRTCSN